MYEGAVQDLIDELGRLPGVGPKSAQRIAFHLLAAEPADVERLAATLTRVKNEVKFCSVCGNVAEADVCRICSDPRRDPSVICVVEEPKDVVAIERTREFRGRYHVLGGAISPIDGIGPDDLRIRELLGRLRDGTVTELILATDPNLEGEATATYLARLVNADGADRHPAGQRPAGRRRPRVRRRGHARPRVLRAPQDLSAGAARRCSGWPSRSRSSRCSPAACTPTSPIRETSGPDGAVRGYFAALARGDAAGALGFGAAARRAVRDLLTDQVLASSSSRSRRCAAPPSRRCTARGDHAERRLPLPAGLLRPAYAADSRRCCGWSTAATAGG